MSRNLLVRVAFAVPAIGVAVAVLWRGGWLLAGVLAVLGVLGTREVYGLARRQGIAPLEMLGYPAAAAIPFAAIWVMEKDFFWLGPVLALGAQARTADRRRAQSRHEGVATHCGSGDRSRRRLACRVRVLDRELEPAA